jgi:tetratricopeptide (TPR) repeat protein
LEELRERFAANPRRYFAPFANELRKGGDFQQAIAICRAHLVSQPGHISGHVVLAQALFDSGNFAEAEEVFQAALGLDPENLIALRCMGDLALARGDMAKARYWYERVLETDSRNPEVLGLIQALENHASPRSPGEAEQTNAERSEQAPGAIPGPDEPVELAASAASAEKAEEGEQQLADQHELGGEGSADSYEAAGVEIPLVESVEAVLEESVVADELLARDAESRVAEEQVQVVVQESEGVLAEVGEVQSAPEVPVASARDTAGQPRRPTPAAAFSDPEAAPDEWFGPVAPRFEELGGMATVAKEPGGDAADVSEVTERGAELDLEALAFELSAEDQRWLAPPTPAPGATSSEGGFAEVLDLELELDEAEVAEPVARDGDAIVELDASPLSADGADVALVGERAPGEASSEVVEPAVEPAPSVAPLATETLAELYLQQGFPEQALAVLREVLARDPGKAELEERIAALERQLERESRGREAESSRDAGAPFVEPRVTAAQFFGSIARRRRRGEGASEAGEGGSSAGASLGSLFGAAPGDSSDASAAARLSGLFSRGGRGGVATPAGGELSLDRVFGDVSRAASGDSPAQAGQGGVDPGIADLNEFRSWLESLRRK